MGLFIVLSRLLHFLGLILGAGTATVAFIINKKAEKNPELQKALFPLMKQFSILIWIGIIFLVISGIGLQATAKGPINKSMLLLKHLLVVLIIVNGIYLGISANKLGKLAKASKEGKINQQIIKLKNRIKFIGTLNIILWYIVIILSVIL